MRTAHTPSIIMSGNYALQGFQKDGIMKGAEPIPQFFGINTSAPIAHRKIEEFVIPIHCRLIDFTILGTGNIYQRTLANFPSELENPAHIGQIFLAQHKVQFIGGTGGIDFAMAFFEEVNLQPLI
ncbi:hypothetical protein VKI21_06860 [Cyanobacterium aponinum UTEX 3222]|uniref:hypothetical protein n=1 Tax=Cyanobacterium aponinum TaxID=379064 RepID=UPI003084A123|nr:hypothetical protein VKI21_06860 [Cyanobacterium aponinum UTEX 3222]